MAESGTTLPSKEVRGCQKGNGEKHRQKDDNKSDVGARRADEVDDVDDGHEERKEGEGDVIIRLGCSAVRDIVCGNGVEERRQRRCQAKPEASKRRKDDTGECVAEEELANGPEDEQKTCKIDVHSSKCQTN